jgi:hypothetical protein
MIARDQIFPDMRIVLDGCSFYGCTFRSCVLIYCASLPVVMQGCQIEGACQWEFDRAAKSTMAFLSTMYRGGATSLVENTFDAIRGTRPKGRHLM